MTVLLHQLGTSFVGSLQLCSHCNHGNTQTAALLGDVQELRLHERLSQNRNLVQFWGHCVKQGCIHLVLELMEVSYLQSSPSHSLAPSISCQRKMLSPELMKLPALCMPALAQMHSGPFTTNKLHPEGAAPPPEKPPHHLQASHTLPTPTSMTFT